MSSISEILSRHVEGVALRVPAPAPAPVPGVGTLRRAAFTPEIRSIDESKRTIEFVASTEKIDRYGDRLKCSGWDLTNYKKNPIFLWAHSASSPPIGKCVAISIETNPPALVQTIEFADAATYGFADQIFRLYRGGFLRSVSVGFRPTIAPTPITDDSGTPTGGFEFAGQELLELSAVPLPANTDAVARAIGAGIVTRDDAPMFFNEKKSSPADHEDVADLAEMLQELDIQMFKLSLIRIEAVFALHSIDRGIRVAGKREHQITTIEGLLSSDTEITSFDQLGQVLNSGGDL